MRNRKPINVVTPEEIDNPIETPTEQKKPLSKALQAAHEARKNKPYTRKEKPVQKILSKLGGIVTVENPTRSKAIKDFCTQCMGYGEVNPKECTAKLCPLFIFRGISRRSYYSDEERQEKLLNNEELNTEDETGEEDDNEEE